MTKGGLVREALGSKKRREGISRKKTDKFSFIFLVIRGAPRLTIGSNTSTDGTSRTRSFLHQDHPPGNFFHTIFGHQQNFSLLSS